MYKLEYIHALYRIFTIKIPCLVAQSVSLKLVEGISTFFKLRVSFWKIQVHQLNYQHFPRLIN